MADVDPAPVALSPVLPDPTVLRPGYQTTEAWLAFLVALLGAVPTAISSSGLIQNAPSFWVQVVGLVTSAVTAIIYAWQRTKLKTAHLSAVTSIRIATLQAPKISPSAATIAMIAVVAISLVGAHGCGGSLRSTPVASGGSNFLQCGKQDLNQLVGDKTLLATVAIDLLSENYSQAIDALITKLGGDAVGCAVIAVDTVATASKPVIGPRVATPQETRAKALIAQHNWKLAPPSAASSGSGTAP